MRARTDKRDEKDGHEGAHIGQLIEKLVNVRQIVRQLAALTSALLLQLVLIHAQDPCSASVNNAITESAPTNGPSKARETESKSAYVRVFFSAEYWISKMVYCG